MSAMSDPVIIIARLVFIFFFSCVTSSLLAAMFMNFGWKKGRAAWMATTIAVVMLIAFILGWPRTP